MNGYKINFVDNTITITADFAKAMNDPNSKEYKAIARVRKDFPDFEIVRKTHRTPAKYINKQGEEYKRNQFKDLTYDRMEKFMSVLPQKEAYLTEYDKVMAFACAAKGNGYPLVRKWFVEQFPQFRKNPMFYLTHSPALVSGSAFLDKETAETDHMELEDVA